MTIILKIKFSDYETYLYQNTFLPYHDYITMQMRKALRPEFHEFVDEFVQSTGNSRLIIYKIYIHTRNRVSNDGV